MRWNARLFAIFVNHITVYFFPFVDAGLWKISYDQSFWLDITSFKNDIVTSMQGTNGYLERLKMDSNMQGRYAAATDDLFDPTK
jgi:hypothetical protein